MTGIIILAAGESSRLGQPKQLVPWRGQPMLRHAARMAIEAQLGPVIVILGAVDQPCREILHGLDLRIAHNPDWASGMGGSVVAGVKAMAADDLQNVIVMLCDQPFIDSDVMNKLVAKRDESGCEVVASKFGEAMGPPVLFSKNRFATLLTLTGQQGAKAILRAETSLATIDCAEAAQDLDTPDDLRRLTEGDQEAFNPSFSEVQDRVE